jgi:hypothetical protein
MRRRKTGEATGMYVSRLSIYVGLLLRQYGRPYPSSILGERNGNLEQTLQKMHPSRLYLSKYECVVRTFNLDTHSLEHVIQSRTSCYMSFDQRSAFISH